MPSTREKESKKVGEEILDLLSKPTAKERSMAERFRSQGGQFMRHLQYNMQFNSSKYFFFSLALLILLHITTINICSLSQVRK